ncbi:MAG TPA: FAD binding domain-containing protein [Albidovulum sp.]|uniref:FAD binding domain-containing protein n=1 Tax=Albidovulum sp. TaxID=1872424 RepID=UPI002CB62BF3|nr:FAD binding domain-containing protein [Albidovulum sp.]
MTILRPRHLDEALAELAAAPAALVAGGTDVFPALGVRQAPSRVMDLTAVEGLRGISRNGAGWRVGASTTWTDIVRTDLPPCFDALKQAARQVGSVQIQNTGTVAGNICNASPAADGVPVLVAMEAEVELASVSGTRRLPLERFITGPRRTELKPGEIVTALYLPDRDAAVSRFEKLGSRAYLVISIVSVAVILWTEGRIVIGARVAVGAASPVPMRLTEAEAALKGRALSDLSGVVLPHHLAALTPIDDVRATGDYRREAALVLIRRALTGLGGTA